MVVGRRNLDGVETFQVDRTKAAVARVGGRMATKASGNVSLETVAAVAETGVDLISIGRITHSAPTLDLGLDVAVG